jgi:polyphosphate kinase
MWGKALESTLKDLGVAIFDHLFNQASNEEAKVLRVIADAELPISTKEINNLVKECNVRISTNNIAKYLQRLVQKRLINKTARGLYTVPDRMFCAYVRIKQE